MARQATILASLLNAGIFGGPSAGGPTESPIRLSLCQGVLMSQTTSNPSRPAPGMILALALLVLTSALGVAPRALAARHHATGPETRLGRALDLLDAGRADKAVPLLAALPPGPLDDLVAYAHGRALLQSGRPREAVALLDRVRRDPSSPWRPMAAVLHADALFEAGRHNLAQKAYRTLIDNYRELPELPRILLRLAATARELGQRRQEALVLSDLTWLLPMSDEARTAEARLEELAAAGIQARPRSYGDHIARAKESIRERRYSVAEASLSAAANLAGSSPERHLELRAARADLMVRRGDHQAVVDYLFDDLTSSPETAPELMQRLGQALRRVGRVDEGLAILSRLSKQNRNRQERFAHALWAEGRLEEAEAHLSRLHERTPAGVARHWSLAWLDYRLHQTERAVAGFREVARRSPSLANRANYWVGRAYQNAGRHTEAKAVFRELAISAQYDYYGYQARARLFDLGTPDQDFSRAPGPPGETLASAASAPSGRIVASPDSIKIVPSPSAVPSTRLAEVARAHGDRMPRLKRASILMRLERPSEARHELRLLLAEIDAVTRRPRETARRVGVPLSPFLDRRRTPLGVWGEDLEAVAVRPTSAKLRSERARLRSLRQISREAIEDLRDALRVVNDPWGVRRVSYQLEDNAHGRVTDANRAYQMATHPLAWRELVEREARREGVCPIFMWAIMVVESAYHESAHSVADARGLLQILPRTARLIAKELGEPEPHPTDLLDPELNIRYGTWYMARLLERFQGQELLAAAAYNAGPHRVAWRVLHQPDLPFDVMLEEIPANRGREYAKAVLRYVGHYRRVYLDDSVVYIGQTTLPPVPGIDF